MSLSIKNVFGKRKAPSSAGGPTQGWAEIEEVPSVRYFEIVNTFGNKAKPLGDHVTYGDEAERLRELRVEAYAALHPSGYRPHDVFSEPPYRPVDPDHMLKEVTLKKTAPKKLPEYSVVNRINVVSARVKEAIEALEPGAHRFYPLAVRSADGQQTYSYYFIQFLERLNCVCFEKSGFEQKTGQGGAVYWSRANAEAKTFLWEDCVGNRHLFWDAEARGWVVASEQLVQRLGNFLPRGVELVEAGLVRPKKGGDP